MGKNLNNLSGDVVLWSGKETKIDGKGKAWNDKAFFVEVDRSSEAMKYNQAFSLTFTDTTNDDSEFLNLRFNNNGKIEVVPTNFPSSSSTFKYYVKDLGGAVTTYPSKRYSGLDGKPINDGRVLINLEKLELHKINNGKEYILGKWSQRISYITTATLNNRRQLGYIDMIRKPLYAKQPQPDSLKIEQNINEDDLNINIDPDYLNAMNKITFDRSPDMMKGKDRVAVVALEGTYSDSKNFLAFYFVGDKIEPLLTNENPTYYFKLKEGAIKQVPGRYSKTSKVIIDLDKIEGYQNNKLTKTSFINTISSFYYYATENFLPYSIPSFKAKNSKAPF
ncbi:MAG: hypothetical protein ACEQSF_01695 [Solirubrobacteraceae bacterium]